MQLPLLVHLVFHPEADAARAQANEIHRARNADAFVQKIPQVVEPMTFPRAVERRQRRDKPATVALDSAPRHAVRASLSQARRPLIGTLWVVRRGPSPSGRANF